MVWVMANSEIALICVYNDSVQYQAMVDSAPSKRIGNGIEVVGVDNTNNRFSSAASALNFGARQTGGDNILVFLHQDIRFLSASFLERLKNVVRAHPQRIFGIAGSRTSRKDSPMISNITEGSGRVYDTLGSSIEEVFTLDECLLACTYNMFGVLGGFDAHTCNGWHLYGADLCLSAKLKKIPSYVIDAHDVLHISGGKRDATFYACERLLAQKYAKDFSQVKTPCTWFPTGWRYEPYDIWRKIKKRTRSRLLADG